VTELQTCPKCGGRVKFSRIHPVGSSTSKRRDCPKCGHADTVLVQEIYHIIEAATRAAAAGGLAVNDKCPKCGIGTMATYKSKPRGAIVWRWRRCSEKCGYREQLTIQPEAVLRTTPLPEKRVG